MEFVQPIGRTRIIAIDCTHLVTNWDSNWVGFQDLLLYLVYNNYSKKTIVKFLQ